MWLFDLEPWLAHLIIGVVLAITMGCGGMVAARAGRSPLWVLLLLVPFVNVALLWAFAYSRWPRLEPDQKG